MPKIRLPSSARGFGRRLRDSRLKAGLNVSEAARALKTSRNIYRQWEASALPVNVNTHKAIAMATLFGVPIGWLLMNETSVDFVAISRSVEDAKEKIAEALDATRQVGRKIAS